MSKIILLGIIGAFIAPILSNSTESTSNTSIKSTVTPSNQSSSATSSGPVTTLAPTTTLSPASTSLTPEQECAKLSSSCDTCVKNGKCLYCYTNNTCQLYPAGKVLPSSDDCALDQARWGVCWLNFEAMIISVSVIGGVIILGITFCCIYCCCCRNGGRKKQEQEDRILELNRQGRKAKQSERRAERKGKLDEIRRKYGLMKDETPYQQFDS